MKNNLRQLARDYKRCKQDWAKTNKEPDSARRKVTRSAITSMRNTIRHQLRWEIMRVEGGLGRVNRI